MSDSSTPKKRVSSNDIQLDQESQNRHILALNNLYEQSKMERKLNQDSYMKIRQYRFKKEREETQRLRKSMDRNEK